MAIRLSRKEKHHLCEITRQQRMEARLYRRARMVLLAGSGESVSEIARQLGTCWLRVRDWLGRFQEEGLEGLGDRPRSGRSQVITALRRREDGDAGPVAKPGSPTGHGNRFVFHYTPPHGSWP